MNDLEIDRLLEYGLWVQVSPLANGKRWVCAIYKKGKKTGNWITEHTKTFKTPYLCYDWAAGIINKEILKQK